MSLSASLTGKLGYLAPRSIERNIKGQTFKFFAVRVPMVAELLALSGPIAQAFTTIFSGDRSLRAIKQKENRVVDPGSGANQTVTESESPALPLETLKYRDAQQKEAISSVIETLVGPKSRNLLGRFVADSMREEFPQGPLEQDVAEFFARLDIGFAIEFLQGALEANAHVIRPFLARAGLNLRGEALDALRDRLAPVLALKSSSPQPASETTPSTSAEPSST